jgi:predicted RNA-binding Zn ribbon-like protein
MQPVNGTRGAQRRDALEFRFLAGHRALDFLSTLGNRHRQPTERLREPSDLDRWLDAVGLSVAQPASRLDLENARRLRETVNSLTRATLAREAPVKDDLRELNEWARRPPLTPQAEPSLQRRWVAEHCVQAALALIAREAVELLTSPERSFIRECAAAPNCSLLYLDRSRAHRRRWCQMETCGSRAKMTDYRHRQSTAGQPPDDRPPSSR